MADTARPPGMAARSGEHRVAGPGELVGGLAILDDADGSIAMGLVAFDVVYVCFVGKISRELGVWCARRLERVLDRGRCSIFMDGHAAEGGNVVARRAPMQSLAQRSDRITRLVCLVHAPVVAMTAAIAGTVAGQRAVVTADPVAFDYLLTDAAPNARESVSIANCRTVRPSVPPLRVVRSA